MQIVRIAQLLLVLLVLWPLTAESQSSSAGHPLLNDTFRLSAGAFFSQSDFRLRADGTIPGEDIDFDESLGVDDSQITAALSARWNFTEKWSVWGQVWLTDSSGSAVLADDLEWEDLIFKAGSSAGAGVENDVIRLFFGREFSSGPNHEFGAGLGLHWMEISAFIEGEAITPDGTTGFQRRSVSADAPLPNIGAWYYYAPTNRWLLRARIDWLSANIGDYDGSLWNVSAGAYYQFTDIFGLALDWQFFELDVGVDSDDWKGDARIRNSGPMLSVTASW